MYNCLRDKSRQTQTPPSSTSARTAGHRRGARAGHHPSPASPSLRGGKIRWPWPPRCQNSPRHTHAPVFFPLPSRAKQAEARDQPTGDVLKWKGFRGAHGFLSRGFSLGFSSALTCQVGKAPEEMAQPIRVSNPSAQRDSLDISGLLPPIMSKNPLLEKSLRSHQHKGP